MRWSVKIGQVAGIGIFIHWTFLILLGWLVFAHFQQGDDLWAAAEGIGFVLAIFGCVVLHELGHALAARRFQIATHDITLLPIGGIARLERVPEDPRQEFWVAIAGPAVNVFLAIAIFGALYALHGLSHMTDVAVVGGDFLVKLLWVNVALALFNMLPAFPMDGGRVLRALLAIKLSHVRATQIAAAVGQGMAILFAILGLFFNGFLLFIALFVFLGAQQEARVAVLRSALRGIPVRQAMITRFRTLAPTDTLSDAIRELLAGDQQDFPVVDQRGEVVGLLPRGILMQALADGDRERQVEEVMLPSCASVEEGEMLEGLFQRMQEEECSALPVTRGGKLVGLVTLENVGEWLMINNALRRVHERGRVDDKYRRGGVTLKD